MKRHWFRPIFWTCLTWGGLIGVMILLQGWEAFRFSLLLWALSTLNLFVFARLTEVLVTSRPSHLEGGLLVVLKMGLLGAVIAALWIARGEPLEALLLGLAPLLIGPLVGGLMSWRVNAR